MVERRTPNREVLGSIPTSGTVLCPSARHINSLCTALVKPRKRWLCADMTSKIVDLDGKPQYKQ